MINLLCSIVIGFAIVDLQVKLTPFELYIHNSRNVRLKMFTKEIFDFMPDGKCLNVIIDEFLFQ